jgi:hypothetical protein
VPYDLEALRALYAEADRALEGWSCELSSDCCHFARTGREPYLWENEWVLAERAMSARGISRKRALPVIEEDDRRCPLLGDDGRCTIYAARPFGCRTFFCDRGFGPSRKLPRDVLGALGKRVAALAEEGGARDGPRPISTWLARRR